MLRRVINTTIFGPIYKCKNGFEKIYLRSHFENNFADAKT